MIDPRNKGLLVKFGKKYSKSNKTALYKNKFWVLGILDYELNEYSESYLNRKIINDELESKLKESRNNTLVQNIKNIRNKFGYTRVIRIYICRVFHWVIVRLKKL